MVTKRKASLGGEIKPGADVKPLEDFTGELSTLEPGQIAKHPSAGMWFFKTPNGLVVELHENRVVREEDGTISVPMAMSADGLDPETQERIVWTGSIDHGKIMSSE